MTCLSPVDFALSRDGDYSGPALVENHAGKPVNTCRLGEPRMPQVPTRTTRPIDPAR
ncbi:MAG: hypothetical protein AB7I48_24480 [Planctomycetaceae bacterium]